MSLLLQGKHRISPLGRHGLPNQGLSRLSRPWPRNATPGQLFSINNSTKQQKRHLHRVTNCSIVFQSKHCNRWKLLGHVFRYYFHQNRRVLFICRHEGCIERISDKALLSSTGNCVRSPEISCNGKNIYIYTHKKTTYVYNFLFFLLCVLHACVCVCAPFPVFNYSWIKPMMIKYYKK